MAWVAPPLVLSGEEVKKARNGNESRKRHMRGRIPPVVRKKGEKSATG